MKISILIISFIFNSLSLFSQAEIKFDTLFFDMGIITEGGPSLKKNIYFTNIGNEPLIITQASTGDGGSMATWDKEPIMPGKKGKITFIYDTKRIGFFEKSINVNSNGKNGYMNYLKVKGEVVFKRTSVFTAKKEINLGEIAYDSIKLFQFYVKNTGTENLHFHFDSYRYYEIDLLTLDIIKSTDSSQNYRYDTYNQPNDSILIKGEIINKYGDCGKFNHVLNFIYNSHDTLKINLFGKFVGKPSKNKIIEGDLSRGKQIYYYSEGKLDKKEQYTFLNKLTKEFFFESSNCSHLIQYHWQGNQIEREYFFKNGKLIEEKIYKTSN